MWIVRETSPAQMAAPLLIPTDGGHHSLNGPVAVSFDAAGNGAALMGRSGGQGDDRCGAPKLARGPAALTASWKTCSPDTPKENDPVMNYGLGLHFAVNGKLYGGWSSPSGALYGKGIILWREP
jgi:hypothetical protein